MRRSLAAPSLRRWSVVVAALATEVVASRPTIALAHIEPESPAATTAIGLTVPHGWDGSPIAMAVTPSPEPSTSTSGTGPTPAGDGTDTASDGDGTSASGSNGSSGVWVLLGTIVAVAVVGVLARRSSRATRPRGRA